MTPSQLAARRANAAIKNLFVADALAMPVHWYYNPLDIEQDFPGGVRDFHAAPAQHPSSIMSLHSTSQGGRGSQGGNRQVVGDVILRGRRHLWGKSRRHYHHGMQAGENTLNAHCVRVLLRCLAANDGHYDSQQFVEAYVGLMTADPPRHPDTYAESYHRGFFANYAAGRPPSECAAVTHDTPSVGGLVTIAALVVSERLRRTPLAEVQDMAHRHLYLTHPDAGLARVCASYVSLIDSLLFRDQQSVAAILTAAGAEIGLDLAKLAATRDDREVIGGLFSPACYISGSWPGLLYLAFKYRDDPSAGLIANTNLGGDNVHRGAVLGVLLGLARGEAIDVLFEKLVQADELRAEIGAVCMFGEVVPG